jgi:hypothetical protein
MKTKIIIFGIGNIFRNNINRLDEHTQIVAIVDNGISTEQVLDDGWKVSPVSVIRELIYDFVVIFNKKYQREIYRQLINEYNLPGEKILVWSEYLLFKGKNYAFLKNRNTVSGGIKIIRQLPMLWSNLQCRRICDYDMSLAKAGIKGKEFFLDCNAGANITSSNLFHLTSVVTVECSGFLGYGNLYDTFCNETSFYEQKYDMVLLLNCCLGKSTETVIEFLNRLLKVSKYILIRVPVPSDKIPKWNISKFDVLGQVKEYQEAGERYLIITNKEEEHCDDIKIYVVTHKEFNPLYDSLHNKLRIPIQAGCAVHEILEYKRDDIGDNISELNEYINELTAMYWVWKNDRCRYVGFEHYRRIFLSNPYQKEPTYFLNESDITHYLEEENFDFIVARCAYVFPLTVDENIRDSISEHAFNKYRAVIREKIERTVPDYLDAFDECFQSCSFYPRNMFITKWNHFDEYCEWLFGIILDIVDRKDLDGYDSYSRRVVGFFAERLLTVWLLKHDYKVKEMFLMG